MSVQTGTCSACRTDGYSPSAAVMLRPGLVQCPDCDGFGTPHRAGLCACPDEDASDHECDLTCPRCGGDGRIECEHEVASG